MKNILSKKLFGIVIIVIVIIILPLFIFYNKKNEKYTDLKNALSNTFFYLDKDDYDDLNSISDLCKISLIYDTNYMKSDYVIYEIGKEKIKGYTKQNVDNSIKKILGNSASINFELNDLNSYDSILNDVCMYNDKIINLSYDSDKKVLYNYNPQNKKSKRIIMANWDDDLENLDYLTLNAQALMIVKNEKYDLYKDSKMEYLIGSYNSLNEAKNAARNNFDKSYKYVFKFKKENNNYIWKEFHRKTYNDVIVD